jgi:hypothetical protein
MEIEPIYTVSMFKLGAINCQTYLCELERCDEINIKLGEFEIFSPQMRQVKEESH